MGFHDDDFPGAPRILFVGWPNSPHTHSWIELLQGEKLNVRLFGLPTVPPADWPVKTYMTTWVAGQNKATRCFMTNTNKLVYYYDGCTGLKTMWLHPRLKRSSIPGNHT